MRKIERMLIYKPEISYLAKEVSSKTMPNTSSFKKWGRGFSSYRVSPEVAIIRAREKARLELEDRLAAAVPSGTSASPGNAAAAKPVMQQFYCCCCSGPFMEDVSKDPDSYRMDMLSLGIRCPACVAADKPRPTVPSGK